MRCPNAASGTRDVVNWDGPAPPRSIPPMGDLIRMGDDGTLPTEVKCSEFASAIVDRL